MLKCLVQPRPHLLNWLGCNQAIIRVLNFLLKEPNKALENNTALYAEDLICIIHRLSKRDNETYYLYTFTYIITNIHYCKIINVGSNVFQ